MVSSNPHLAANYIVSNYQFAPPKVGIVLGSGLGALSASIDNKIVVPYSKLPGFPELSVKGHSGNLILGQLNGQSVVCLEGRSHSYERTSSYEEVKTYVRTLKLLGCEYFIATNASGSLQEEIGPGELMLIDDHINFQPGNPLVGANDDAFGPRFPPLDNAYDKKLKTIILEQAQLMDIQLHTGVYISVLGPCYETAAEIRAFKLLGADAVGMSTVPEVIVANHCGMKVAVIATITNHATGLATSSHDHENVLAMAHQAAETLCKLVHKTVGKL